MFYLLGTQTKQHIPQINAARPCEQGWEWTGSLWTRGSATTLNSSYKVISFHTSIANSFNSAFFWIDSISPTAKPICLKRRLFFQGKNLTAILGLKLYQVIRKISIERAQRRNFNLSPIFFPFSTGLLIVIDLGMSSFINMKDLLDYTRHLMPEQEFCAKQQVRPAQIVTRLVPMYQSQY